MVNKTKSKKTRVFFCPVRSLEHCCLCYVLSYSWFFNFCNYVLLFTKLNLNELIGNEFFIFAAKACPIAHGKKAL